MNLLLHPAVIAALACLGWRTMTFSLLGRQIRSTELNLLGAAIILMAAAILLTGESSPVFNRWRSGC